MSTGLRDDIQNIKLILTDILNVLNKINTENFDQLFPKANELTKSVVKKREELRQLYPEETLRSFNPELDIILKEINKKSDSVLLELKTEQNKVSEELKNSINKKNLAKYR